ncbi:MAG: response regulator transcription factor [Desulfuromonadales bacterium]|nr:response regulator transcription factor [Desulfuromonadales bacterium]
MTSQAHILLVEDEVHIAQGLVFNLELEGYQVSHAETGATAMALFAQSHFDLVVLDLMLPDSHGLDLCRQMRDQDSQLPILILTALGDETDRVKGLEQGADDYLGKPFNLDEFLLRISGMLRRSQWYQPQSEPAEPIRFGDNLVDLDNLSAQSIHGEIALTELEGKMLQAFFSAQGRTLSRSELLEQVWGLTGDTETRSLDNFVVRLRKYFEQDPSQPRHFLTVRGKGYRFIKDIE